MIIVDPTNNVANHASGRKTLELLVRRSTYYARNLGHYADFGLAKLEAAVTSDPDAAVNLQALNAVLAAVAQLPQISADSEGSDTERVFFSVAGNWEELARTTLDILYAPPGDTSAASTFLVATRGWCDETECVSRVLLVDERRW